MSRYYSTSRNDNLWGTNGADDFYLSPGGYDYINGYGGFDRAWMNIDLRGTNATTQFSLNRREIYNLHDYLEAKTNGINSYTWTQSNGSQTTVDNVEFVGGNVIGGNGNDRILFQNGTAYHGGNGYDHIFMDWSINQNRVVWDSAKFEQQFQLRDNFNQTLNTTISGFEQISLITGTADDFIDLRASYANNEVMTGDGNDTLYAGHGKDVLTGGRGNDVYAVNNQTIIVENPGEGIDTVYLKIGTSQYTLGDSLENLAVGSNRYDDVILIGNDEDNRIVGANGNDILDGGRGADTLIGGAGNDTYYVDNLNDRIIDTSGEDTVIIAVHGYEVDRSVIEHVRYAEGFEPNQPNPDPVKPDPVKPDPVRPTPVEPGEQVGPVRHDAGVLEDTRSLKDLPYFMASLYCGGNYGHMGRHNWDGFGHEHTVTYSFAQNNDHGERHFKHYTDAQISNIEQILHHYESVTNLNFVRVRDSANSNMRFYRDDLTVTATHSYKDGKKAELCSCCGGIHSADEAHNDIAGLTPGEIVPASTAAGYAYYGGDVHINSQLYNDNFAAGNYSYTTVLHEVGHSVGLKHPGNYDASGFSPNGPFLPHREDNTTYSVMSYNHTVRNVDHLQDYDLATLHFLYGVNENARSEDNTYNFQSHYIWDGNGHDVFDAHAANQAIHLSLKPGAWSYLGNKSDLLSDKGQAFIGYDTAIEDAIGGRFNDFIEGNGLANKIEGGQGNDTLYGLGGSDILIGGDGADTLIGGIGSDVLTGGAGKDTFVFDTLPGSGEYDIITDFTIDESIVFDSKIFTALSGQQPGFIFSDQVQGQNDHLIFDREQKVMFYDADGAGDQYSSVAIFKLGIDSEDLQQSNIVIV